MNQTYSFYDPATGLFTGQQFTGSDEALLANLTGTLWAMPGRFDHLSQAVEPMTGRIIDYQPPSPGDDYVWDETARRWLLSPAAQQTADADTAARERLDAIDRASIRALREAAIGDKTAAVAMLTSLEAEAVTLREDVVANPQEAVSL